MEGIDQAVVRNCVAFSDAIGFRLERYLPVFIGFLVQRGLSQQALEQPIDNAAFG